MSYLIKVVRFAAVVSLSVLTTEVYAAGLKWCSRYKDAVRAVMSSEATELELTEASSLLRERGLGLPPHDSLVESCGEPTGVVYLPSMYAAVGLYRLGAFSEAEGEISRLRSVALPLRERRFEGELARRLALSITYNRESWETFISLYSEEPPTPVRRVDTLSWLVPTSELSSQYETLRLEPARFAPVVKGGTGDPGIAQTLLDGLKRLVGIEVQGDFKTYALLLGVHRYKNYRPLPWAYRDLQKMVDLTLRRQAFDVDVFENEEVDRQVITNWLREKSGVVGPRDRILIYYSGHGEAVTVGGSREGFMVLSNAMKDSAGTLRDPWKIPLEEVRRAVHEFPVRHKLVILDSCFAGLIIPETKGPDYRSITAVDYKALVESPSEYYCVAGTDRQTALSEKTWLGSVYTDAFVRGARGGADLVEDAVISILELDEYVRKAVRSETAGSQTPLCWPATPGSPGAFVFLVPRG